MQERIRQLHEDVEQAELQAARLHHECLRRRPANPRVSPLFDHATAQVLVELQRSCRQLLDLYADQDGLLAEELASIGCDDDEQMWRRFYDRLKQIKESYKTAQVTLEVTASQGLHNAAAAQTLLRDVVVLCQQRVMQSPALTAFSPTEALGLRLDMLECYRAFLNLKRVRQWREDRERAEAVTRLTRQLRSKGAAPEDLEAKVKQLEQNFEAQPPDYVQYLRSFSSDLKDIPRSLKYNGEEYARYLDQLLAYLRGFVVRVNPLADHDRIDAHMSSQFDSAWHAAVERAVRFPSWEPLTHKLPLYCMPTDRLFASQGTLQAHLQKSGKYAKALREMQQLDVAAQAARLAASEARDRQLAFKEFRVQLLSEILSTVVQRTIDFIQERQSRTWREIAAEGGDGADDADILQTIQLAAQETGGKAGGTAGATGADGEDSDDELLDEEVSGQLYNPRNLPLGWDGKPIPFWLFQLHGLNVEYKCEICGNFSYWGRRSFERHFQEWRHSFGMKCLGIPNTAHFKEIVKIEDAVVLWERIRSDAQQNAFDASNSLVEFEDPQGNLYTAPATETTAAHQAAAAAAGAASHLF